MPRGLEEHFTKAEVAKRLHLDPSTVWRLAERWRETGGKEGLTVI
jgi:hypothetical protein